MQEGEILVKETRGIKKIDRLETMCFNFLLKIYKIKNQVNQFLIESKSNQIFVLMVIERLLRIVR